MAWRARRVGRRLVAAVLVVAAVAVGIVTVLPTGAPSVWAADALGFVAVTPAR